MAGSLRRFKPYPAYKDTGVEWLGEIPTHWELKRLKRLASVRLSNVDKKSVEGQEAVRLCNYTDVYYNDRITPDLDFMTATATRDQVRRFSLRAGDVLITKDSESWMDIAVPAVVVEHLPDVLCGYHLAHIRPSSGCVGAFLSRAFSAIGPRDQFQVAANGITRFGLGGDAIQTGMFAMPPEPEQRAIAAFLDRETARIDALVAKKERLIELLQEKRTALITRAVTQGLDPNAPMKDSGVEWLGKIPAHWEARRLKLLVPNVTVGIVVTPAKYYVDEGVPCLRSLNVSRGAVDRENLVFISDAANDLHAKSKIFEGDVVVVRTGQAGAAAVVPPDLDGANCIDLLIIRRSEKIRSQLIYYYLNSRAAISQAASTSVGAIQAHYNTSTLVNLIVPRIPIDEQDAIIEYLGEETKAIDQLSKKIQDGIDRLSEFRTALISAAVTGKIDVREEAV
jgi:type I restriction enzyme S subunit